MRWRRSILVVLTALAVLAPREFWRAAFIRYEPEARLYAAIACTRLTPAGTGGTGQLSEAGTGTAIAGGVTTWTIPAGTDVFYNSLHIDNTGTDYTPGSALATDGAPDATMGELGIVASTGVYLLVERWDNPTAGAQDYTANWGANRAWRVGGIACDDVDTGDPDDTPDLVNTSGLFADSGTISSAVGDLMLSFISWDNRSVASTGVRTTATAETMALLGEINTSGGVYAGLGSEAGAATVQAQWETTSGTNLASIVTFNVNVAAAAGGVPQQNRMLIRMGRPE